MLPTLLWLATFLLSVDVAVGFPVAACAHTGVLLLFFSEKTLISLTFLSEHARRVLLLHVSLKYSLAPISI